MNLNRTLLLILSALLLILIINSTGCSIHDKNIFEMYSDDGLKRLSQNGQTQKSNLSVTQDGFTISIKESYYDKSRISIGMEMDGKPPHGGLVYLGYYENQEIGGFSGGYMPRNDDLNYAVMSAAAPPNLPEKLILDFSVTQGGDANLAFNFHIPLDRTQADMNTSEVSIMKTVSSGPRTALVKTIRLTPSCIVIDYEYSYLSSDLDYQLLLFSSDRKIAYKPISKYSHTDFIDNLRKDTGSAILMSSKTQSQHFSLDFSSSPFHDTLLSMQFDIN